MPQIQIFACPSCGASTSIEEGDVQIKCPFCGNTIIVPEELRIKKSTPPFPPPPPPPSSVVQPPVSPTYPPVYRPQTRSGGARPLVAFILAASCTLGLATLGAAVALFELGSSPEAAATQVSNIELPTIEF